MPVVAFVVLTADAEQGRRAARALRESFGRARIRVGVVLLADGARWWDATSGDPRPGGGTAYDVGAHPFRAQAVVDGAVTHRSRADLAAGLAPDAAGVARVERAVRHRRAGTGGGQEPWGAERVAACCTRRADAATRFTDEELAAVALAVRDPVVLAAVCAPLRREGAAAHVELWSDALRRSPGELAGPVGALLGLAAWLEGNGALAWCAVDRALAAEPGCVLAHLVGELLEDAVPPSTWSPRAAAG